MMMTWQTMKVKRYTDKLRASCWRNDRDLVIAPTTLGFTPHSIRAEIWRSVKENEKSHKEVAVRKFGSKNVETYILEDFIKITKNQIEQP